MTFFCLKKKTENEACHVNKKYKGKEIHSKKTKAWTKAAPFFISFKSYTQKSLANIFTNVKE